MKRNLLFLILIVVSAPVFSQNWAPINATEKFCYSSDDNLEIINNVLWVDSLKSNGNSDVFFMNKIVKLFDEEQNHFMYDEPQFLGDSIIISDDGSWEFIDAFPLYEYQGGKIYPYQEVGYQWNFLTGINAEIISKEAVSLFGETDSIKTILLSNNQHIVLSKNHGITNWRDEQFLVGIEGRDLGTNVFMFEDMFKNLDEGDVLCINKIEVEVDYAAIGYDAKYRYKVLDIEKYIDSVIINADYYFYTEYNWGSTTTYSSGYGNRELKYYRNDTIDMYPNQSIYNYVQSGGVNPEGITISTITPHHLSGIKKTQHTFEGEWGQANIFEECENLYPRIYCPTPYDLNLLECSENFGIPEYKIGFFEHWLSQELVGVIDDGDTLGTIYFQDLFVGENHLYNTSNWFVYPNPTKDYLSIQTAENNHNLIYKIYNLNGLLLQEGKLNQSESSISIKELPKGMYFIELNINGELTTKKWIKN